MPDLKALAAFAARLREPDASFGNISEATGTGTSDDPIQMPYWQSSSLADEFIDMAYDAGWVAEDFDWPRWMDSNEAKAFLENPNKIASANVEQLQKLLTVIIRSDRYCEGTVQQAFDQGLLQAITVRAVILHAISGEPPFDVCSSPQV